MPLRLALQTERMLYARASSKPRYCIRGRPTRSSYPRKSRYDTQPDDLYVRSGALGMSRGLATFQALLIGHTSHQAGYRTATSSDTRNGLDDHVCSIAASRMRARTAYARSEEPNGVACVACVRREASRHSKRSLYVLRVIKLDVVPRLPRIRYRQEGTILKKRNLRT